MSLIIDTVNAYLPIKKKTTPSKWTSFNAICCIHNGTSADKRRRGGIFFTPDDGVIYHCFNCQFKTSWYPGRPLGPKFKKFLHWLNVPDDLVNKCIFEAMRLKNDGAEKTYQDLLPTFFEKPLPRNAKLLTEWAVSKQAEKIIPVIEYVYSRGLTIDSYPWYWTNEEGFDTRLIIPYFYDKKIVGYTARSIVDAKPKYISEQQPGFVFNLDNQTYNRKYVIVCEGQIDAISVDGVAFMANELAHGQHLMINRLQKEVIVVPDRDHDGPRVVKQAIELGWSVSFPDWKEGIKDINHAVQEYGKLYTLYNILEHKESSSLKIQLLARRWFNDDKTEF